MATRLAQPVTVTIPTSMLSSADRLAKEEGRTRSEVFREGLRALLWKRRWEAVQTYGARLARRKGIKQKDIERIVDSVRT